MASTAQQVGLTVEELERRIQQVEPAAFLVPPGLLRRVIKQDRVLGGIGLFVPHAKGYVIGQEALRTCVEMAELGLPADAEFPTHAFLMVRPVARRLVRASVEQVLRKYWRILFHLRIDCAMQKKLADGSLNPVSVRQRIRRLGMTEFAEITDVLRQENYLLPPDSPEVIYAEFVAVYLTLRRFDPDRLAHFFPALSDIASIDALVAEDFDGNATYEATRLFAVSNDEDVGKGDREIGRQGDKGEGSVAVSPRLPASLSGTLGDRLSRALGGSDADAASWNEALGPVQARAAGGGWSQEARLLVDLESVCDDCEQGVGTVDLVEWAMSLGELPIKRQLPNHQVVAIVRRLRGALDRMRWVQVTEAEREGLTHLLAHALEERERGMRERFRPLIVAALDDVGIKPNSVGEVVGRSKLVEELLDRVVEKGHFSIGNLRDAISRNQMKLPDLKSPIELFLGDPLIRLNRKLAVALDGVYRRGEFYMRCLHRLSSIGFGNILGRLFVLYLILPVGLAYFSMITPEIAFEEGEKLVNWVGKLTGLIAQPAGAHQDATGHGLPTPNMWGVVGLSINFVLLFNVRWYRERVFYLLGKVGQSIHAIAMWLAKLPALRAFLHHRFWTPFRRVVFWPTLLATICAVGAFEYDLPQSASVAFAALGFVLGIALLNTALGRAIEETFMDGLLHRWTWLTVELVPGLFHWIMDFSRRCVDGVEQVFYVVNDRLRFRRGENSIVVCGKAVLGLTWFWVMYVIRFAINLLIEPQVNPIKHFPVVTVSHKICLPMIPTLAELFRKMGVRRPTTTATGIIFGIPGIFGFMVWELKENWRLYASNRAANLKPVIIGSHGETMYRLLHPGFHSGTVPKLLKRLRKAERYESVGDSGGNAVRKLLSALHHVEESVEHFIERELIALLRQSKAWAGLAVELKHVRLATNRVAIELNCSDLSERAMVFSFDYQSGWLVGGVLDAGWLPQLTADQRQVLDLALAGLYRLAGVDLTREEVVSNWKTEPALFSITEANGLRVWIDDNPSHDVIYDLTADLKCLLLSQSPIAWVEWVRMWEPTSDQ